MAQKQLDAGRAGFAEGIGKSTPSDRDGMLSEKMPSDVTFLITESSYFLSHRRPLADACVGAGWRTTLVTNLAERDRARLADLRVIPFDMQRASHHPLREMRTLLRLVSLLRRERPRLLHAVGLKPVLYGSFAARVLGLDAVCTLAGLGYLFTSGSLRVRLLRRAVVLWLRLMFRCRRTRVILQNDDDSEKLVAHGIVRPGQVTMVRGSGVDLVRFQPSPEPDGIPVFAVVARMLADKGIREVVLAARLLRWRGIACRVRLIGDPDEHNPSSLSRRQLAAWAEEGVVEWPGYQADIAEVWRQAHVCVLPSYREGLPKTLLEAGACGRPIITTDVPGCRSVVTDGAEGLLVPARDWRPLAEAMERLALAPDLRARMGRAARSRVEAEFGQDAIVGRTMDLFREILERP